MARMIDADNLMKSIEDNSYSVSQKNNSIEKGMTLTGIRQCIEEQPTVDAEPVRRGKWIEKEVIGGINSLTFKVEKYKIYKCSLCRIEVMPSSIKYKYCPECGAKMEECENE